MELRNLGFVITSEEMLTTPTWSAIRSEGKDDEAQHTAILIPKV